MKISVNNQEFRVIICQISTILPLYHFLVMHLFQSCIKTKCLQTFVPLVRMFLLSLFLNSDG